MQLRNSSNLALSVGTSVQNVGDYCSFLGGRSKMNNFQCERERIINFDWRTARPLQVSLHQFLPSRVTDSEFRAVE